MKPIIALIFFLAAGGITFYFSLRKKLNAKMTCVFLVFAIVGGFGIANYDFIKKFKWLGAEFETFERKVETVKDKALEEIRGEITRLKTAQDETRKLVHDAESKYSEVTNNLVSVQTSIRDAEFDLLVVMAKGDNRHAFDKISSFARNHNSEYFRKANVTVAELIQSPSGPFQMENWYIYGPWSIAPLPKTPGEGYATALPEHRRAAIDFFWNHTNYTRLEKLDFLVGVITNDSTITAMVLAKKVFDAETKPNLDYRAVKEQYSQYWSTNRARFVDAK